MLMGLTQSGSHFEGVISPNTGSTISRLNKQPRELANMIAGRYFNVELQQRNHTCNRERMDLWYYMYPVVSTYADILLSGRNTYAFT